MKMIKYIFIALAIVLFSIPGVTGAAPTQGEIERKNFYDTADMIVYVIRALVPAALSLLVVAFFFGLSRYVFSAGDPEKAKEGKNIMLYGALAMFVGLAIWGIISYIVAFFGIPEREGQFEIRVPHVIYKK